MKLKYYMRGLGIGILITTIVLSFNNRIEKLSDKDIMVKARELGMVMKDEETDDKLEEVLEKSLDKVNSEHNTDNNDQATQDITENNNDSSEQDPVQEGTDIDINEPDDDSSIVVIEPEDSSIVVIEPDDEDSSIDIQEQEENSSLDMITFTIVRGMSSGQVSELLLQKGLIDEALDFDNYIKQKGKAGVIRIGTYTLSKGASYQDILQVIVG
jgi:hypothetical protein